MPNLTTTDIDTGRVALGGNHFESGVINFAGADVLAPGTILARHTGTLKYQLYVKGGSSNGNGVPVAVLTHELDVAAAGDVPVRPIVSGPVNKNRLVIDADGDDANIDATVRDLLRSTGIIPQDVSQLSLDDNPQQIDS